MYTTAFMGKSAEEIACRYLNLNGYEIIGRNWYCRWGELDIIALQGDVLVFVEVRYRKNQIKGQVEESMSGVKKHHLARSVMFYLSSHKEAVSGPLRVDLITIYGNLNEKYCLKQFKNLRILKF